MCGLNGVFGLIGDKEKQVFAILSMLGQLRGKDSTGYAIIPGKKKQKPAIIKSLGGLEFLANTLTDGDGKYIDPDSWVLKDNNLLCVLGHNRYATVGVVNVSNAHPFQYNDIIGCHNGTINRYSLRHLDSEEVGLTDSQVIIKELGDGRPVEDVIEFCNGAWALTWFNTKTRILHMCRNEQRTLYVFRVKNNKTLFWASESWMLDVATSRLNIDGEINKVVHDQHLEWKISKNGTVVLHKVEEAEGGKFRPVNYAAVDFEAAKAQALLNENGYGWGGLSYFGGGAKDNKPKKDNVIDMNRQPRVTDETFEEVYVNTIGNSFIHRRRYEALTKDGCCNCTGDIGWGDRNNIVWKDYETPLCLDCAEYLTGKEVV